MNRPFYTSFAWAYDLLIHEPVAERLQFIIKMLAQVGIMPGAQVLDAGCGTGRYTVALAEHGFKVTGIDASLDQILEARKRQERKRTDLDLVVGDICNLPLITSVDAVLCRGVLNDITDDTSRHVVFFNFAEMLRPSVVSQTLLYIWRFSQESPLVLPSKQRF